MLPFARKIIVALTFLAPLAANADPIQYIITALPPGVEPLAINNSGAIAGELFAGAVQTQAFVMQPGGPIVGIGTQPGGYLPSGSTVANSINNSGQVAGSITTTYGAADTCTTYNCGFIYSNGGLQVFTSGYPGTLATSINDSGVVAGTTNNGVNNGAYTYSNGQFQYLGTLPGDFSSYAYGINNSGEVVGDSNSSDAEHAFLYADGTMQSIGTLPGDTNSYAYGINNLGQVVGTSFAANPSLSSAFIYDSSTGQMTALGYLPGSTSTGDQRPEGINDSGEVVGYDLLASGGGAFLYSDGSMYNLNGLLANESGQGWDLQYATGINASGDIVGYGTFDGVSEGFILMLETPEPNARMICLVLALLIASVHRARLRKRAVALRAAIMPSGGGSL
jgi:probable HAF family extracellular repeat protein